MYKPVPQVLPHDDDSENEVDTSICFDQRFQDSDELTTGFEEESLKLPEDVKPFLSPGRKAALFFSIFNCIGFVLLFLWALPCDCYICTAPPNFADIQWEHRLNEQGIVRIDIASSKSKLDEVVITVNRALSHSNLTASTSSANNLKGFSLLDGKKRWEKNLTSGVEYLNCSLIDANKDGIRDCMVFTYNQGLSVFDSTSGEMLWKCHSHQNPEKSSSPTSGKNLMAVDLVNDLNGDGTSDLLVIVSDPTNSILIAISGRSGELLWQHNLNLNCTQLSNLPAIDYIIHHPFCIINKESAPAVNVTLTNIRFESVAEMLPTLNALNDGQCPDCRAHLILPALADNTSVCNVTFTRMRAAQPIDYLTKRRNLWKMAFKSQHWNNNQNGIENHVEVIEIDEPCDGTFKILAHIAIAAGADVHYILHEGLEGLRDSLVVAECDHSAGVSILKKIHL